MRLSNQVAQAAPSITLVQSVSKGFSGGSALAYGSNNTGGNFLVAMWSGTTTVISDSNNNSWILLQNVVDSTGSVTIAYCVSCVGGANTVTVNSGGGNPAVTIAEFTGVTTLDQSGKTNTAGAGASWTSNAITTTVAKSLLIGAYHSGFGSVTLTSPFNTLGTNESFFLAFYEIVSTIQTAVTAGGTQTSNAGNGWGSTLSNFYTPTVNPNSVGGN